MKLYSILLLYMSPSCYDNEKYNILLWCNYHNGIYLPSEKKLDTCRFNDINIALNAANDPLKLCIYNWKNCTSDNECNDGTGYSYCVKSGCCSPGYCMVSKNGIFTIPKRTYNYTYNNCIKNGGIWNKTNQECSWYNMECG